MHNLAGIEADLIHRTFYFPLLIFHGDCYASGHAMVGSQQGIIWEYNQIDLIYKPVYCL